MEDKERLARLEAEMMFSKELLTQINNKLDLMQSNFMQREEIEDKFETRDERINRLENQLNWVWRALITGMASWLVALISYLFLLIKGGK